GVPQPPFSCPDVDCATPCSAHQDEKSCSADPLCAVASCPDGGGNSKLHFCFDKGNPSSLQCPPLCSTVTSEAGCAQRSDCHAVYADPGTCACAPAGCCMVFQYCAPGLPADCSKNAGCRQIPPTCGADFLPSLVNGCWEGCVHKAECGLP